MPMISDTAGISSSNGGEDVNVEDIGYGETAGHRENPDLRGTESVV
jgi:hypothetical protein